MMQTRLPGLGWNVALILLLLGTLCSAHQRNPLSLLPLKNRVLAPDSSVYLNASPSMLQGSSGYVKVVFGGVKDPSKHDWIAVFSPADVNFTTTAPVSFHSAYKSPDYLKTGNGSWSFYLINMRADYVFVFFRSHNFFDEEAHSQAVAVSNRVEFEDYNVPTGGHLALTHNPAEMSITWTSKSSLNPQVKWGKAPGVYDHVADASTYTYTREQMCGGDAAHIGWRDPGLLHTAVMTGLEFGQKYYYMYGDEKRGGWSAEDSFVAAPKLGPDNRVSVIAYGDMGKGQKDGTQVHWQQEPSLNTTNNILNKLNETDLILHIGDISYAVGFSAQWDQFMDQIEPIAGKKPYMTCIGNHERDFPESGSYYNGTDSGGECGVPYSSRLVMPGTTRNVPWYSFDYGNIHFTLLSTEDSFLEDSEQLKWMEKDLASVDRAITPWLIVAGHRPMYIDSTYNTGYSSDQVVAKLMRKTLEPLLLKYRVDVALWGHNHSYQRTCPVANQVCDNKTGIVHVVIGMAGANLTNILEPKAPKWIEYENALEYGYTQLITTPTTLEFKFFNNSNQLRDRFVINKKDFDIDFAI